MVSLPDGGGRIEGTSNMLAIGTKLFAPDNGFGEKHGEVMGNHPCGEYVIKWDQYPQPMIYSPGDKVDEKVAQGIFMVVS